MNFLFVGVGGAMGAALRYGISSIPVKTDFPILTLLINTAAAVIIGFFAGLTVRRNMPEELRLFVQTGFCGGFSTLSALSLEAYNMNRDGRTLLAGFYCVISLAACLAGVWVGEKLAFAGAGK